MKTKNCYSSYIEGLIFWVFFYEMHYHGYLDALKMMMQISDQVMLDEIANRCDWGAWLKLMPEKMEEKLQNAEVSVDWSVPEKNKHMQIFERVWLRNTD